MAWPKKIVLVRHAESTGNILTAEERTKYEVSPDQYPLTERGEQQAAFTGQYLREHFSFDIFYSSYYLRAQQTMKIMFPESRIYEDPRLAEANRGIWHTLTRDEVARMFPAEIIRRDRENMYHYRPWGGENWPDIELRIHSFLGTLARDYEGQSLCIIVHGSWLILFQRLIEHFSIQEAIRRYKAGAANNASVTIYEGREVAGKSRLVLTEQNLTPWIGQIPDGPTQLA